MKKLWVIPILALFLAGCGGEKTLETVNDTVDTPVVATMQQVLVQLPEALSSPVWQSEKTGTLTDIGVPVVLVLGIIALGSLLSNKSKKTAHASSAESTQKDDGFYKPYFCDEYGHDHYPTDPDFMFELRRYSNRNMVYYNVAFKEHELDWYIVDGHGNTISIRNQSTITMRDHYNHYCRITLK